ncbi:MlaD family protein [Patulibacter defluvii]|uniref:MlaD family protein n=1 Tax=Patulibacter defluvii TaxID=3095358 RepID=UPI002A76570F|nr:MlaD family protein [Patulibacter sp. DM4]
MIEVRDRISGRINRARLQLEVRRAARPSLVVLLGVAIFLAAGGYIVSQVSRTLLADTYEVRIEVADARGVVVNADDVRFRGIPAGSVTKVEMVDGQPVLTARIQREYGRIYQDARAMLRPNTALQDMFVDIVDRGTPAAGPVDAQRPLRRDRTTTPVHVDEVLDVFRGDERARMAALLDGLGNGMEDRGARLRTAFAELVPVLRVAGDITRQLGDRRPLVQRLVRNSSLLTAELGAREQQLRRLIGSGSRTAGALAERSGDLDAVLRGLPPTLTEVDTSFAAVRGVLGDVDRAVRALRPVARRLPGTLADLRRLNATAAPAVRSLERPVGRLLPLADALPPLSADASAAVAALRPQVPAVEHTVKALAGCKKGVQGFFQWNASMSKFGDSRGSVPRGNLVVGLNSNGILPTPFEFAPKACTPGAPIPGRPPRPEDGS